MTKSRFQVRISGSGVSPETVSASELGEVLITLEKTFRAAAQASGEVLPEDGIVSLVNIREGSSEMTFAVVPAAAPVPGIIARAVRSGDYREIPIAAHEGLLERSQRVVHRNWEMEFVANASLQIEQAIISAEHEVPAPAAPSARGATTIYGRCISVGGVRPRARIRLGDGNLLAIDITESLAKQLAHRLYEVVGIEGVATWRTCDWVIVGFQATRVLDYEPAGATQAFEDLAKAAKGRWNDVNAEEFVRQARSEDHQ